MHELLRAFSFGNLMISTLETADITKIIIVDV